MKTVWIILAAAAALLAVFFALRSDYDKAFIAAAFGGVCWFLHYRVQMKELVRINEPEPEDEPIETDDKE